MIALYSKSDQSDIPIHVIRRIIEEYKTGRLQIARSALAIRVNPHSFTNLRELRYA